MATETEAKKAAAAKAAANRSACVSHLTNQRHLVGVCGLSKEYAVVVELLTIPCLAVVRISGYL